jgi:hypothetical protein
VPVETRERCPECEAPITYGTTSAFLKFLRCSREECSWASWQPPSLFECAECAQTLYWTHTRQHLRCKACNKLVVPSLLAKGKLAQA